nr:hypothetical protein [Angustibacter aerolatus]
MFSNAEEVMQFIRDEDVKFVDVRFCDLPGVMQHFNVPAASVDASLLHRRPDVRRVLDPRLPGDPRVGHEAHPRRAHRLRRPLPGREDAERQLLDRRPVHRRAVQPRPAPGRGEGRGVPEVDRHRRHRVLRPRGRVLHLRRRALRDEAERRLLLHRLHRGRLEHRPRRGGWQPRPQDAVQGRVLPRRAGRPLQRPARPDGRAGSTPSACRSSARTTRWAPPVRPRSTTASTSLAVSADKVMLFKYVIKNVAHQHGKTVTFMPKPLFGDNGSGMHCHQSLWKDGEPLFYDERGYGGLSDVARWYIGGLLKHAPSLLAFTNPTVNSTTAWCPATRPPSTWSTPRATAPPACGSRSPARTRRPSASSSACPTRRATPTWRSRRC